MPETLLQTMAVAIQEPVVAFTEFILAHKKNPLAYFCFFEGIDDFVYYKPRIFIYINAEIFFEFNCGGKNNVKEAYRLIKSNETYSICKSGFFIDRDYDELNGNSDFYETPYYSVENFYVSDSAIREILIDCFNMRRDSNDLLICINAFNILLNSFLEKTLQLNSWLSCYSDLRAAGRVNRRLKIDSTINPRLDNTVSGDLSRIYDILNISNLAAIEVLFACPGVIEDSFFSQRFREFEASNQREIFRGKFLLKFLSSFLRKLQIVIGTEENSLFPSTYNTPLQFEYSSLMILLNSHAETPACLTNYLQRLVA